MKENMGAILYCAISAESQNLEDSRDSCCKETVCVTSSLDNGSVAVT
jgi:hypothetical protein